jgi:hypothetical protein
MVLLLEGRIAVSGGEDWEDYGINILDYSISTPLE